MKTSSSSSGGGVDGADIGPYPNEQFIISSHVGEATGCFNTENVGGQGLSGSDILTLNVGGEKTIDTLRSTLTYTEGSKLAEMFSGRWDDSLPRNEQGHFLIDYEPELFMPLLKFLRDLDSMTGMNDNRLPPVTPSFTNPAEEASFRRMVDKFGLTNVLFNYEIYIMGTDHGTWNDMIHASMDCSILDYEMTATAEEAVRFFTLDRPAYPFGPSMVERSNRFKLLLVKGLLERLAGFAMPPSLPIQ
ncbi:hypothetical protein MPSEU_000938400 [Mayamaea pseudoterrestris]|nr:hypothetical protein MPSEU_000938400 [Mayamaea pseudoterrestris]